eukprot:5174237-Pleurochrysis_carterae.AAC.5
MLGRARSLVAPACRRRCMKRVASAAGMIPMWCEVLDEWMARQRCVVALSVADVGERPSATARRTYRPANLVKGTWIRFPLDRGGDTMVSLLPNRHSVCELSQSWETDSNDSPKEGTQRTPLKTTRITLPDSSFTDTGKSPMAVQLCGLPSMPAMVSFDTRVLIRSSWNGCTCHEHPLSMMNPTLRAPLGKRRSCLPEWRFE